MPVYYAVMAAGAAATAVSAAVVYRFKREKCGILLRVAALAFLAVFFARFFFFGDEYVSGSIGLTVLAGFPNRTALAGGVFQIWFSHAAAFLVVLFPFYRTKWLERLAAAFGIPVFLCNIAFFGNFLTAFCGPAATAAVGVQGVFMALEQGFGLAVCAFACFLSFTSWKGCFVKKPRPYILAAAGVAAMILCSLPDYAPQALLGEGSFAVTVLDLSFVHRVFLYLSVAIPIAAYFALKDADEKTKRFVILYYLLQTLLIFSSNHRFEDFRSITSLPLHLCNTALYIMPLCFLFRWKKLFYFTYFVNVQGAFFAMMMPNYDVGLLFSSRVVGFWSNHFAAFYMPILFVALGVFPRPKKREFRYSVIAFAVYFLVILVINAWFTNYNADVDYFFLNSDFIAEKLGTWAEDLRDIVFSFTIGGLRFTFYPLYQALYFLVYLLLSLAMWFVYELGHDVIAGWADIRSRKRRVRADRLALDVALAGRSEEEPMQPENADKLILKKFTKRYGSSDVYAVKDADLEVCGGEIFGFLGPNGAGKSTIIKSIVGIQTITGGAIEVCGYDVKRQPVQAKRMIGFVPDHYALYEKLTAREYINYIADLYGVTAQERKERLDKYVRLFEFESAIDNQIKTYSHGMKQKVTIMAALIHDPKVWILDEPLTGLDPNSIFQVKECMKQHAQAGNIVFFSSHIIDVVERICDRIAIIRKGQIQCVRSVAEIEAEGTGLEQFYLETIGGKEVLPVPCREGGEAGEGADKGEGADRGEERGKKKRRLFKKRARAEERAEAGEQAGEQASEKESAEGGRQAAAETTEAAAKAAEEPAEAGEQAGEKVSAEESEA